VDSQKRAPSVTMLDAEPRPEGGGDGDVSVEAGETVFQFSWKGGDLAGVTGTPKPMAGAEPDMMKKGIVTCQKCAYDTDTGHMICWPVPC
jgi:hypothetical protein